MSLNDVNHTEINFIFQWFPGNVKQRHLPEELQGPHEWH